MKKMNLRIALKLLTGLFLVIGLWLFFRPHPLVGVRILPELNIADVASIQLDDVPVLSRRDGKWRIDAYDGYPADENKVAGFLHSLTNMTVWEVKNDQKTIKRFWQYPLKLTLRDSSGWEVAELMVGYDRHGVGCPGWVESRFAVDGSYLLFSNEVVAVHEQFEMFHGHDLSFERVANNSLDLVLPMKRFEVAANPPTCEFKVSISVGADQLAFTMREVPTNRWQYATSCEIVGMRPDEMVNIERARQFINDLSSVPIWFVRKASKFSTEERLAARRKRTYVVYSSDGKSSCERTFSLYEGKDETQLEMEGWVYPIRRDISNALLIDRRDLVLSRQP